MRKPMVAGNWKMNGTREGAAVLLQAIKNSHQKFSDKEIVVFPSFIHLPLAEKELSNTDIQWGAQNLYLGKSGAFTGEISGAMLKEYGCRYVLIGHSERRLHFHEDLNLIAEKFKSAIDVKLKPILCVGETKTQREKNETEKIIKEQIISVIEKVGIKNFEEAVIAYEPVWAIGTGLTATPAQAQIAHAFIRKLLAEQNESIATKIQLLYGGSVKADNAAGLFLMPDIDGALVGGASLEAESFLKICEA